MEVKSETIKDAWKSSLKYILKSGEDFTDENNRVCREVLNLIIEVNNPGEDITVAIDVLNRFKKWVYPPLDEIGDLILSRKLSPTYSYSYGPRLFNFQNTINQIDDFIIPLLKRNSFSRRGIVLVWNTIQDSNIYRRDVPGLISIYFKIRKKKLNATMVVRSNDIFFGWPANLYQIFVLQDYIAKKLGCQIGSLTTFSNSAHIFKDQFEDIQQVISE
ncbi:MAG: hypothetical protein KKF74_04855 [Nanoarchaeota archaeon]|nr:hypothetical protein [Nanoarchaeota archaeon]